MKITVLGAGVVGLTTAYFLKLDGHDVEVIEKNSAAAMESSFSNGAQLSYTAAQPWSNFGALKKGFKWMGKKDAPLLFKPRLDLRMWRWLWHFVFQCNAKDEKKNTKSILDICLYSRKVLHQNLDNFDFEFDYQQKGKIFLFNNKDDFDSYKKQCELQDSMGGSHEVLSIQEALKLEPALENIADDVYGIIRDNWDESGDTYKFCLALEDKLKAMGVKFSYETEVLKINKNKNEIESITTNKGETKSDKYVICLGVNSPLISETAGVKIPIYPLKGYSITIDINDESKTLNSSVTYYSDRTVFSRLGNKLRVAGTAEFAGFDTEITKHRIEMMKNLTHKVFPECGDVENASEWACIRACTPDCAPVIGKSKYNNLYINTGQGSLGWTMSFASAKLTADIIAGNKTEISMKPYRLNRFAFLSKK